MPQPNKIPLAFAASGDRNAIPESTETTGLASWREGFPAITSAPFSEGGIAPKRADFNGIFNALSLAIVWQQQGGFYAYDNATDYEIGNVVLYSGDLYKCLTANGPGSAVKAPTDATVWSKVMTAADAAALYLPLSGGQMSGNITKNVLNDILYLSGGLGWDLASNGARLVLYGKDHSSLPGVFRLSAGSSVGTPELQGKPDGSLTWDGSDIITLAQFALSSQVSTNPRTYKTKLPNGVMLQATYDSFTTDSSSRIQWTFPEAFYEVPFVFALKANSAQDANIYYWGGTSVQLRCNDMTGTALGSGKSVPLMLLAVGRWK